MVVPSVSVCAVPGARSGGQPYTRGSGACRSRMSMFILSQNGKVGVYGNGDRVYGSGGTEKAIIMNGAENVVVENTVEEIHVANNMAQLTFRVDTNTNEVSVVSGSTVLAKFAPEAAGIKLFTATGMSVIKSVVDTATGEISFTADNGSASATPVPLPTNGSALPSDAIDTNAKSDNAGGTTPTPPVTPTEEGITVAAAAAGLANGTYKGGDYILDDSVSALNGATYAVVNGAKSITVADTVKNLKADDAANALALASNVSVEDGLKNLALNDPFDFGGKPTTLVVTSAPVSNSTVKLGDVTVAEAAGAQAKLDAFLAKTTGVTYADGVKKPEALKAGEYNIVDNATNVIGADVEVLAMASKVSVADTVANIAKISTATFAEVDAVTVNDSLANITQANVKLLSEIVGKGDGNFSFAASDTTTATAFLSDSVLSIFSSTSSSIPKLDLSNLTGDKASLTIMLEDDDATSGTKISFKDANNNPFENLSSKVTLNIVGTDGEDTITLKDTSGITNPTRIDGGLGKDTITLSDGADIVVLGTDFTKAGDFTKDNADSIVSFNTDGASALDKLEFADFLAGFDSGDFMTIASGEGVISGAGFNGKIIGVSKSVATNEVSKLFSDATVGEGDDMIVITTSTGTGASVWYVADTNADGGIAASEINLVATLAGITDAAKLTADNFA